VVAGVLEAEVEPIFHPDSYGYRPRRSALDAVGARRQRCWEFDWVVEFDIRRFFDSVPWDLIVTARLSDALAESPDWSREDEGVTSWGSMSAGTTTSC
jgi:hypothetical protein